MADERSMGDLSEGTEEEEGADVMAQTSAETDYSAAVTLFDAGDIQACMAKISRAMMLNPREPKYYKLRARASAVLFRFEEAVADLRYAVAREEGKDAVARHELASNLARHAELSLQQTDAAAPDYLAKARERCSLYEEVCSLHPLKASYSVERAKAHQACGELAEAAQHATRAIDLDEQGPVLVMRAQLHWQLGEQDSGDCDMTRAARLTPYLKECMAFTDVNLQKSAVLYAEATQDMQEGRFGEAVFRLTQAIAVSPEIDVKLLVTRASVHRQAGDLEEALLDLEVCSADCKAALLGDDDDDRERDFSAVEPFIIVRQRDLVYNEMALRAMLVQDFQQALAYLNRVIAAESALSARGECAVDHRFFLNRGDCHSALGSLELANADFYAASALKPDDENTKARLSAISYSLGANLFNSGDYVQAEVELTRAIKLNRRVGRYFAARGKCSYFIHKFDAAAADYKEALRLDPTLTDVRSMLLQFGEEIEEAPLVAAPSRRHVLEPDEGLCIGAKAIRRAEQQQRLPAIAPLRGAHSKSKKNLETLRHSRTSRGKKDDKLWGILNATAPQQTTTRR